VRFHDLRVKVPAARKLTVRHHEQPAAGQQFTSGSNAATPGFTGQGQILKFFAPPQPPQCEADDFAYAREPGIASSTFSTGIGFAPDRELSSDQLRTLLHA
jgi:hypothetical protein